MQSGLPIEEKNVAVPQVAMHDLDIQVGIDGRLGREQLIGDGGARLRVLGPQPHNATIAVLDESGAARIHARAVHDRLAHLVKVERIHRLRVCELAGERLRHADLVRADVHVRRDDRAAGEVDALAHHVLAKQALLLLEHLFKTVRHAASIQLVQVGVVDHVHRLLNLQPRVLQLLHSSRRFLFLTLFKSYKTV